MLIISDMDPITLSSLVESGNVIIFDVREADEYSFERIPSAINLPLSTLVIEDLNLSDIPLDTKIVFQCKSGVRSGHACSMLSNHHLLTAQNNDRQIYNLVGGIVAWKQNGFDLISSVVN